MGQPHKHAEVIKAWADGAEIQEQWPNTAWTDCYCPSWNPTVNYRVKPKNITVTRRVYFDVGNQITRTYYSSEPNIEYTFDPEGKLLEAKVLK